MTSVFMRRLSPDCMTGLLLCALLAAGLLIPAYSATASTPARTDKSAQKRLDNALLEAVEDQDIVRTRRLLQLLRKGASPNATAASGITALMLAVGQLPGNDSEELKMVSLLLRRGARVNATDRQGQTALMKAALFCAYEGNLYGSYPAGTFTVGPLPERPLVRVMQLLLARGAKVNARDKNGQTALMLAAFYDESPRCIKLLLDRGADVHARDRWGGSALDYAVGTPTDVNANAKIIALLRRAGAKTWRPTGELQRRSEESLKEVVFKYLFLEQFGGGAKLDLITVKGKRPSVFLLRHLKQAGVPAVPDTEQSVRQANVNGGRQLETFLFSFQWISPNYVLAQVGASYVESPGDDYIRVESGVLRLYCRQGQWQALGVKGGWLPGTAE